MINKCTFIGNLGKDPDYKVLESGHKVASFSIACSRKVKNKENGETKEYTEWIPIVAWDNLAEIISQLARKGSQVYVEGEFRTRSYEAEGTGEKRYVSKYGHAISVCSDGRQNHRLLRFLLRPTISGVSQHRILLLHHLSQHKRPHSSLRRERSI